MADAVLNQALPGEMFLTVNGDGAIFAGDWGCGVINAIVDGAVVGSISFRVTPPASDACDHAFDVRKLDGPFMWFDDEQRSAVMELHGVYVLPDHRRDGVAQALLDAVIEFGFPIFCRVPSTAFGDWWRARYDVSDPNYEPPYDDVFPRIDYLIDEHDQARCDQEPTQPEVVRVKAIFEALDTDLPARLNREDRSQLKQDMAFHLFEFFEYNPDYYGIERYEFSLRRLGARQLEAVVTVHVDLPDVFALYAQMVRSIRNPTLARWEPVDLTEALAEAVQASPSIGTGYGALAPAGVTKMRRPNPFPYRHRLLTELVSSYKHPIQVPRSAAQTFSVQRFSPSDAEVIGRVLAGLDRLHSFSGFRPIPVIGSDRGTNHIEYSLGFAAQIRMLRKRKSLPLFLFHEIAHLIDGEGFRPLASTYDRSYSYDSLAEQAQRAWLLERQGEDSADLNRLFLPWYEAVWTTRAATWAGFGDDPEAARYLTDPQELFARSYEQWAMERCGDTEFVALVKEFQGNDFYSLWHDADFEPVAAALDQLFANGVAGPFDNFPDEALQAWLHIEASIIRDALWEIEELDNLNPRWQPRSRNASNPLARSISHGPTEGLRSK